MSATSFIRYFLLLPISHYCASGSRSSAGRLDGQFDCSCLADRYPYDRVEASDRHVQFYFLWAGLTCAYLAEAVQKSVNLVTKSLIGSLSLINFLRFFLLPYAYMHLNDALS